MVCLVVFGILPDQVWFAHDSISDFLYILPTLVLQKGRLVFIAVPE
jgi:hypothetical protein